MADLLTDKSTNTKPQLRADLKSLLLTQKTELIEELTRAMANQFNNTMMAISSYAELEMKKAPPSQRRSLEQVLSNAARATILVQKLLTLSRRQPMSPQPLDLNKSLTEIRDFIEQLIGENGSVVYSLDPAVEAINADPAEVEQVVLSLAINARNAMSKGGTLTATTKLIELTKESPGMGQLGRLGKYVMLSIDDTGSAQIADEDAFEAPSTPDQDSRVNLSFAAVRGIVQNSQGMVRFSSEPGKGSSFKIYFPVISQFTAGGRDRTSPRSLPVARTVLVVEDDDSVLVPATEFLKMEGFKVLQARTGAEAIRVVQQNRSLPDVLITDIIMPKMSGREVAEKLRELHPGLKVLFMSGDASAANLPSNGTVQSTVLRKPFRLDSLKDKIHELLGE